jgi:hypothetical protein
VEMGGRKKTKHSYEGHGNLISSEAARVDEGGVNKGHARQAIRRLE